MKKNNNFLSDRDRVWRTSIEAAKFYPLLGIGNSNWKLISYEKIKESLESRGEYFDVKKYYPEARHAHNLYLNALTERGIIGLTCLMSLISYWLITLFKSYRYIKYSQLSAMLWGASFSAWLMTSGVGLVNSTFHHENAIIALFFLGLHLAYFHKISKKPLK